MSYYFLTQQAASSGVVFGSFSFPSFTPLQPFPSLRLSSLLMVYECDVVASGLLVTEVTHMKKLYLTVAEAAEYVGIGEKAMRDYVNSTDPPPHLQVGGRRLIQRKALAAYFEGKQQVRG